MPSKTSTVVRQATTQLQALHREGQRGLRQGKHHSSGKDCRVDLLWSALRFRHWRRKRCGSSREVNRGAAGEGCEDLVDATANQNQPLDDRDTLSPSTRMDQALGDRQAAAKFSQGLANSKDKLAATEAWQRRRGCKSLAATRRGLCRDQQGLGRDAQKLGSHLAAAKALWA